MRLARPSLRRTVQVLTTLGPAIGPMAMLLVRNDHGNLRKAREAAAATASSGMPANTLRELLDFEVASGLHTCASESFRERQRSISRSNSPRASANGPPLGNGARPLRPPTAAPAAAPGPAAAKEAGARLADPSAAISVLWLRRSLTFTVCLMENLMAAGDDAYGADASIASEGGGESMTALLSKDTVLDALNDAYESLRPYHGWLAQKSFGLFVGAAPRYDDVIAMVGPGLGDADRNAVVRADMGVYTETGRALIAALEDLYCELGLEDIRKV